MTQSLGLNIHKLESKFLEEYSSIVGIDEVGRGSMAGPMVVVGFQFSKNDNIIEGVTDSKLLSKKKRNSLYSQLIQNNYKIVKIPSDEIDSIGLTETFKNALRLIQLHFGIENNVFLIDGNMKMTDFPNSYSVIKGDSKLYSVACASNIAKVYRDNLMYELANKYIGYDFEKHVGYCTKAHLNAVKELGILDIHRKSYKPIKDILDQIKQR